MSGAALLERPLQEGKIKRTDECEADLSEMLDTDKAETVVEDERPLRRRDVAIPDSLRKRVGGHHSPSRRIRASATAYRQGLA
jgi:hypothetical protein